MPMLTDLADACRKSGLRVVEEPGWRTRGHGAMAGVRTVALHHTAGPRTGDLPSLRVVRDGRPGLAGPLSQLMLSRSGAVHVIAAGQCWHAGATWNVSQSNPWAIGIEAEATGVDAWPAVQYEAYLSLVRALCAHYRVPYANAQGHKEICKPRGRKSDPNFSMDDFRARLGRAPAPGVGTPAIPPKPKGLPDMIERQLVKGLNEGRIVCPTGSISGIVGAAWASVSCTGGGRVQMWFQKGARVDGPAPGAGKPVDWTILSAERPWVAIPDGTEFIDYRITANGPGSLAVEQKAK